mgnify:CR=1 FL=1
MNKWIQSKQDLLKSVTFMERLKQDKGIRELATSPILLTLLCLVFEESGTFPANRSELYNEGLDVLLKKWDVKRNIERDQVYKQLSLKRKEDLLSQIAINTFEPGNYFFKQKEVEREINDYIRNLPGANIEENALQTDSEAVLKSIEAQHGLLIERARGIYSFSRLTIHEYFTERKLVSSVKSDIFSTRLLPHLYDKRWREVFLLITGMLESADNLLLTTKQQIDELVKDDENIQQFLVWAERKTASVDVSPYKPAAVRAFYFSRAVYRTLDFTLSHSIDHAFDSSHSPDFTLDLALGLELARARSLDLNFFYELDQNLTHILGLARSRNPLFARALQAMKWQLPSTSNTSKKQVTQWWTESMRSWTRELRALTIQHRDIEHDWNFNLEQKALLQQYYNANQLLVDCLNSDCYISRSARHDIEIGLLLPRRM